MPYSGFTILSSLLSAFITAGLAALPAQAQAPRPGQLAPGPGQIAPPGPRAQPPQAQPPMQGGQAPQQQARQPAPPKPYKPVAVTLAQPYSDPSFAAFRKQLGDIANRKDRAALAQLIAGNFFWMGEKGDKADKKKTGIDNLAAAIDLGARLAAEVRDPIGQEQRRLHLQAARACGDVLRRAHATAFEVGSAHGHGFDRPLRRRDASPPG